MTTETAAPDKQAPEGVPELPDKPAPDESVAGEGETIARQGSEAVSKPDAPPETEAPPDASQNQGAAKSTEPQTGATGGGVFASLHKRMITYTVAAALAGILAAWFLGSFFPNFLLYGTPPQKTDAIVLLLGSSDPGRQKQVDDLAAAEMARYVIVPWTGRIHPSDAPDQPVEPVETARIARDVKTANHRSWVERTHVEMLQTKALMDYMDLTSAIVVSSPYHMRRIKIIADHDLSPTKYTLAFVPTAYEPRHVPWFLAWPDVKWVFSEWGKSVWYYVYHPFFQTD